MKLEQAEKLEVQNLLKLIRRAKFDDLQGLEALALSRAYYWLEGLLKEPEVVIKHDEKTNEWKQEQPPMTGEDPFNKTFDQDMAVKPKRKRAAKK